MQEQKSDKYQSLAERYTKALLSIAKDHNAVETIASDLNNLIKVFEENQDISDFFTSAIIKITDKKEILEKSFKNKINDDLYKFLNVLADKNRLFILPEVNYLYNRHVAQENNILEVEVQTVIELDGNMKNLLKTKLEAKTNKVIKLKNIINKDIIGGVVLLYDGKVIDGSIKTQLKELQMQLV